MLKTIKGKVIAGTVTFALVAGAGAAFASQDAGDNLKAWYDGQFKKSSKTIENQTAQYVGGKVIGLTKEYNALKSDAKTSINTTAGSSTTSTNLNVSNEAGAYITDLNQEKQHIESYLAGEFDSLSAFADGLISKAGQQAVGYATKDLGGYTSSTGASATTKMTTDINASTKTAKEALQLAITNAKNELQADLDSETALTVTEIKGKIDDKIAELRLTITGIKDGFVLEQQKAIAAAALVLENAAKEELESIVDGI